MIGPALLAGLGFDQVPAASCFFEQHCLALFDHEGDTGILAGCLAYVSHKNSNIDPYGLARMRPNGPVPRFRVSLDLTISQWWWFG